MSEREIGTDELIAGLFKYAEFEAERDSRPAQKHITYVAAERLERFVRTMRVIEKIELDPLHQDLLRLLDEIDTQDNPALAGERFSIIEKHGYRLSFLTGPKGVVDPTVRRLAEDQNPDVEAESEVSDAS